MEDCPDPLSAVAFRMYGLLQDEGIGDKRELSVLPVSPNRLGTRSTRKVPGRYLNLNYRGRAAELFVYYAHSSGVIIGATINFK